MLDVRRLRVLRAIARHGSMAGAADALGYTQPAISHHVRRFEQELGTALVVRSGRGVQLTEAAEALVRRSEAVFRTLDEAEEEVAAIAGLRSGRVHVVCFPSGSATLVPRAIARLRERHPGVEVSLEEAQSPDSLGILRAGDCDLVVAFSYPGVEVDSAQGLHVEPLLADRLQLLLPQRHPLEERDEVALGELADADWIAGCPRCRGQLLHLCREQGFEPRITFATDDYVAVESMVAAGLAVALMPSLVLTTVRNRDLVIRPVEGDPARHISLVTTSGGQEIPAVSAMSTALREVSGELVDSAGLLALSA